MDKGQKLRCIPGMDIILNYDWIQSWEKKLGRLRIKRIINQELAKIRADILEFEGVDFNAEDFKNSCVKALTFASNPSLRRVINATGVVIHTNLGRSLIADEAVNAMTNAAKYYSNLEYDLQAGKRGQRNSHVEDLLCAITGAESALVVNNNAGAVMLALTALANGSEVVVSRGELVEIGGSFRIPDIMALSGAKLIETGTTNRTHLYDYERAITEKTSMLLKVHPSNFRIDGFTTSPERRELAKLAHANNLIFMEDAGSGLLIDLLPKEADDITIKATLDSGADLVTFSGDKILGGPQIGGIAGKKIYVDRIKEHPMARALRVDKVTLAGFESTLRLYAQGRYDQIPTLRMLMITSDELHKRAESFAEKINGEIVKTRDAVGGGSYPEIAIDGWGVAVNSELSAGFIQKALRNYETPVLCGAHDDRIIFHVRTFLPGDESLIISALEKILNA